jgi:acyl-CoA dehydrogenase
MDILPESVLVDTARCISQDVLAKWAPDVDAQKRFPHESMVALHEANLVGFFVPEQYGGLNGNLRTFRQIAAVLGESCLSTALVWAMHCQQVAILANHAREQHSDVLKAVARNGCLVASVTTEYGKGGDLLTAQAPILVEGEQLRIRRSAPIVSCGGETDFYLITMRSGENRPANDVCLVLVTPEDGQVLVTGEWNAMGMRGTHSVPMEFDVLINPNRIIGQPFRQIALQTMVPIGHLGWSAAWFGAARGAFRRYVQQLGSMGATGRQKFRSDLFTTRIANIRLSLDLIEAFLHQITEQLERLFELDEAKQYENVTHNIALNNLKIASSQLAFSVANELVELGGLNQGYVEQTDIGLERVFRDLRSAALMYHNDRLFKANGKLILVENSAMEMIWSGTK